MSDIQSSLGDPISPEPPDSLISDFDLYLISEGTHRQLWKILGANETTHQGEEGWRFAVWAPNARRISVIGPFCRWDSAIYPLQRCSESGVWAVFVPGLKSGDYYKFEIETLTGQVLSKADPMARFAEKPPGTASRLYKSEFVWSDQEWMDQARTRDVRRSSLAAYEVHLGSWEHGGGRRCYYRELAPRLVDHVKALGFNYLELLPVAEHPFTGSWGYQVTGYYAPTSRYGDPDDFRFFVNYCHQHGVGVILDWVPAHFVKDAHGLGRFDGTALYEHEDPRRGEHPDWGTYIFNYGRFEVSNFLIANVLYWLTEFHIDGLRVDAVASMLYLDYSRKAGEWLPNSQGGRENFDAIALLREVNRLVEELFPGRFLVAEESTSWPGVTRSPEIGGLGFTFKWNMGWMHDTLGYFALDPLFRSFQHEKLTFGMMYEYSEAFVNPLSHDEVVHGKGSLLAKVSGDPWRKMANLRALLLYTFMRPGKKLLFMGSELGSIREWNHETGLDWYLLEEKPHRGLRDFVAAVGAFYQEHAALWEADHEPRGFRWIACDDRERSIFVWARFSAKLSGQPGAPDVEDVFPSAEKLAFEARDHLVIILNLTPVPRPKYRVGIPAPTTYTVALNSDSTCFGGSGYPCLEKATSERIPHDGCQNSIELTLPPLAGLVLLPRPWHRQLPRSPKGGKSK